MKPTEAFQAALYAEMLCRIQETDANVPYRKGGFYYYSRTEQGKQYPIYCRRKASLEGAEEVTGPAPAMPGRFQLEGILRTRTTCVKVRTP